MFGNYNLKFKLIGIEYFYYCNYYYSNKDTLYFSEWLIYYSLKSELLEIWGFLLLQ